jgi:hypothetical protein
VMLSQGHYDWFIIINGNISNQLLLVLIKCVADGTWRAHARVNTRLIAYELTEPEREHKVGDTRSPWYGSCTWSML